jgi:hypothetical protein
VRWTGTFEQNRGPESGVEAVPGTYTLRLIVDGKPYTQPLTVKADPRDPATTAALQQRHAFLTELNAQLSRVDTLLNTIDARSKHAPEAERSALQAFKKRLTQDPKNIEDLGTVQLRERLLDLLGRVGSTSFQAPTAVQQAEAATLRDQTQSLSAAFEAPDQKANVKVQGATISGRNTCVVRSSRRRAIAGVAHAEVAKSIRAGRRCPLANLDKSHVRSYPAWHMRGV